MSEIRLHLESGLVLRAQADAIDDRSARVSAELPWLRVGGDAQLDLDDGERRGRIDWIGLEPGTDGAARLSVRITFERARPDSTLPYFSTRELPEGRRAPIETRAITTPDAEPHPAHALVQLAHARRAAIAFWRVGLASLALFTLLVLALTAR